MAETMRKILRYLQGKNKMAERQTNDIREALEDAGERIGRAKRTLEGRRTELHKTLRRYAERIVSTKESLDEYKDLRAGLLSSGEETVEGYTLQGIDNEVEYAQGLLRGFKKSRAETMNSLADLTDQISALTNNIASSNRRLAELGGEE